MISKIVLILNVDEEQRELPRIYWLPKLHKSPFKARFIIAAPNNALKPLSKALTAILKLFFHQIESYHKKCQYFSGINSFWVIESNKPVIDCLKKLSSRKKAKSLSTFDFSTLYTKIPHDKLLAVLNELVDFCFSGGRRVNILAESDLPGGGINSTREKQGRNSFPEKK